MRDYAKLGPTFWTDHHGRAWKVPQIKVGETVGVLGFTFTGEKGDAVLRAEYLFVGGQAYGLRSSPA